MKQKSLANEINGKNQVNNLFLQESYLGKS